MIEVVIYETQNGRRPYVEWLNSIRDKMLQNRVIDRIERVSEGNFGDIKTVGKSVFELRLHFGSGYRIYLGQRNNSLVVLLVGGDKSTQERDIWVAQKYWADYKRRFK